MQYLSTAAALTLCALAAPVMANVTPEQVWEDFEAYLEGFGYTVEGRQIETADGLEIKGLTLSMVIPDEDGAVTISMDQLMLLDNGDGTVSLSFPEITPISMSFNDGSDDVEMVFNVLHEGLDMVVSGDSGALNYDYSAESIGLSLASVMAEGEVIPRDAVRFDMTAAPVEGFSETVMTDGLRNIVQEGVFGDLTYTLVANDPEGDAGAVISGTLTGVTFEGSSTLPTEVDITDMAAAMAAGLSGDGTFAHQGGAVEIEIVEVDRAEFNVQRNGETNGQETDSDVDVTITSDKRITRANSSSGSGYLTISLLDEALRYAIGGTDASFAMSSPDLPFPVSVTLDESRFDVLAPLGQPGEMQEARLGVTLAGLTVPEMLWNIFDPGAALPRDPATLVLDLTAMVTPFVSIFDEEAMMALGDDVPGELNALTLEGLELSVAGGSITGMGDMVFDNTDLETFDGFPRPEGQVTLQVSGANALIDSLIAMGLVAESDAMGARMMLSMFTVPGDAPDTATSTLEITPEGQVLANGQRIR